ncbi:MAG: energy-coupling factor ABC transporter ATP-binding protein [Clostridiales Family XIII bacterium]|jgi:cobalt/nickel transport system ATP-binding protein|nr:energy-coupling factor ABC transporter ATP-binding protein [Clostridiales Family XIII bacterium]
MLEIKDLTVEYADGKRAVDGIRFTLGAGENAALIGANGAGKTTLLHALVGVLEAKTGVVAVDGVTLVKKSLCTIRKNVGLVFQNPDDQLFMPDIFEDVAFGPRNLGLAEDEVKTRVDAALETLGIAQLARRSPLKLSGGEKRLSAIAAVLAMEPQYLLFDEPTAFLDPRARRGLAEMLSVLPQGKLIATHQLDFAAQTCSRVLLLQDGKLVADGGIALLGDKRLLESAGL